MVAHAEQAPSLAAAANELRRDAVELPGAMRWVERRVRLVHHVLSIVIGLLPDPVTADDCIASIERWASRDPLGQRLMANIDALDAVDERTFEMSLSRP